MLRRKAIKTQYFPASFFCSTWGNRKPGNCIYSLNLNAAWGFANRHKTLKSITCHNSTTLHCQNNWLTCAPGRTYEGSRASCSMLPSRSTFTKSVTVSTRRPASADSTARRQFQFQYLFISRVHLFYDIQWKRIRVIPFIAKSHNNTDNKSKCIF